MLEIDFTSSLKPVQSGHQCLRFKIRARIAHDDDINFKPDGHIIGTIQGTILLPAGFGFDAEDLIDTANSVNHVCVDSVNQLLKSNGHKPDPEFKELVKRALKNAGHKHTRLHGVAVIDSLFVTQSHRNSGVGRRLMHEFARLAGNYADVVIVNAFPPAEKYYDERDTFLFQAYHFDSVKLARLRNFYRSLGFMAVPGNSAHMFSVSLKQIENRQEGFANETAKDVTWLYEALSLTTFLADFSGDTQLSEGLVIRDPLFYLDNETALDIVTLRMNIAAKKVDPRLYASLYLYTDDGLVTREKLLEHREAFLSSFNKSLAA